MGCTSEKRFLNDLCKGMAIHRDPGTGVVMLSFGFRERTVFVFVMSNEDVIQEWVQGEWEGEVLTFSLWKVQI